MRRVVCFACAVMAGCLQPDPVTPTPAAPADAASPASSDDSGWTTEPAAVGSAPVRASPDAATPTPAWGAPAAPAAGWGAPAAPDFAHALVILYDNSGSMLDRLEDRRKMDVAQSSLEAALDGLAAGTAVALFVFDGLCDVRLAVPWSADNHAAVRAAVRTVEYRSQTPLAKGIAAARDYIARGGRPARLVLVTDGDETCGGDPVAETRRIRAQDVPVESLSLVSIGVDAAGRQNLQKITDAFAEQVGKKAQVAHTASVEEAAESIRAAVADTPAPPPAETRPSTGAERTEEVPALPAVPRAVSMQEGTLLIRGRTYEVWTTHGETEGGVLGLKVHLRFTLENHNGVSVALRAHFFQADGTALVSQDDRYQDRDGRVTAERVVQPSGTDAAVYDDCAIFVPYEELHLARGRRHDLKTNVSIHVLDAHYPLVASADEYFYVEAPR